MGKKQQEPLKSKFASLLLKWDSEQNTRQMPWKAEKDPYLVWVSEIILQQTRVEQGLGYYNKFIKTFPDIHKLARAKDEKIFKTWEGLGYYTRCRNLIATARSISRERKGKFPSTYSEILSLKGIGPYTAAAIASFAFNLPHAVVDGNVLRVLSRLFGIAIPVDSTKGKKIFVALADELLDRDQPGRYNQAIMDFGAVVCKPAAPLCSQCVFKDHCSAFLHKRVNQLPVKEKRVRIRERWFYYLVPEHKNQIAIRKRTENDIWQNLYEFPLVEAEKEVDKKMLIRWIARKNRLSPMQDAPITISPLFRQQLSHQRISGRFIRFRLRKKTGMYNDWQWVEKTKTRNYAFPQFIHQYLRNATISQPSG